MSEADQLAALRRVDSVFTRRRIDYWLFGGWAVDFHAGSVTRDHDDLDTAVWLADRDRIDALLSADGWTRTDDGCADAGFDAFRRGSVTLEVAYLERDADGTVFTPVPGGRGKWPSGSFSTDVATLNGVRARVVTLDSLIEDKSVPHDDPTVAAKDAADRATLARIPEARADAEPRPRRQG